MNFSEQPPSTQWAALKYRGLTIAEVWFKPEGEPLALAFRIPRKSFQIPDVAQQMTAENLLKAVAVAPEDVESWRRGNASNAGVSEADSELRQPLPAPVGDDTHLNIHVRLKPPTQAVAPHASDEPEIPAAKWQELEARWKAIETQEAAVDTLRLRMEGLRAEMEASAKKSLTMEEKLHALNADVAQWNKAKSRVHFALPKVKEYIHRATWAMGTADRKKLEELFKDNAQPHIPRSQLDTVHIQLESLFKDRQILATQGAKVFQECQSLAADVQGVLRTLQSNAQARKKKQANRAKNK